MTPDQERDLLEFIRWEAENRRRNLTPEAILKTLKDLTDQQTVDRNENRRLHEEHRRRFDEHGQRIGYLEASEYRRGTVKSDPPPALQDLTQPRDGDTTGVRDLRAELAIVMQRVDPLWAAETHRKMSKEEQKESLGLMAKRVGIVSGALIILGIAWALLKIALASGH